jgi:hypothetical protein
MRADIHGGPEHSTLQSEAGYIDARPQTDRSTSLLQRTAAPYIWVESCGSITVLRTAGIGALQPMGYDAAYG